MDKVSGRAPSGQALVASDGAAQGVSTLSGFDPSRVTVKQIIARIIAPETWKCMDAWESQPDGVRQRALNSLAKADIILKLVGATGVGTLLKIRLYIDGLLDSELSTEAMCSSLKDWAEEIDDAIAGEAATARAGTASPKGQHQ